MRYLRLIFWAVTAGYWVLIATLTHLPPKDLPHLSVDDKLQHFLAYAGLAGVLGMALWVTFPARRTLPFLVFGVALLYGAIDEYTQQFVGRTPELDDWLADAAGAAAGVLPAAILQRVFEHKFRKPARRPRTVDVALAPELEAALDATSEPAGMPEIKVGTPRAR